MTATSHATSIGDSEPDLSHHASFVLRCWTSDEQVRARLIDVHSGVTRPLADLAELPGLVRRLMAEALLEPPKSAEAV